MRECDHCGNDLRFPYKCSYCDQAFCGDHQLPESHDCDGVRFLENRKAWFRVKDTGAVVNSREEFSAPEPMDVQYTYGGTPDPDFESSPAVKVKENQPDEGPQELRPGLLSRIVDRLFG